MNDRADIKRKYRQFAVRECRRYSDVYDGLALAVSEDDDVVSFLAGREVADVMGSHRTQTDDERMIPSHGAHRGRQRE